LRTFSTVSVRYFQCRNMRLGTVAEKVLRTDSGGVVSCDCSVGDNRLAAEKQRYRPHLLRDPHTPTGEHADLLEVRSRIEVIQALCEEAKAWRRPLRCAARSSVSTSKPG
jgi:hypothetical protein